GEEVIAFVVKRSDVRPQDLDELCLQNIARFKRPREYRFVEALPKNNYGKVLKTELRKLLAPLTPCSGGQNPLMPAAAAVLRGEVRVVHEVGLAHRVVVERELNDEPLRQRRALDAHRVGPDLALERVVDARLERRPQEVAYLRRA